MSVDDVESGAEPSGAADEPDARNRRPDARPREVTTVEELQALDEVAMVRGYQAGLKNDADYSERDKGYWHGFLNGMVDGRHVQDPSGAQQLLTRAYVASGALRADVKRWAQ